MPIVTTEDYVQYARKVVLEMEQHNVAAGPIDLILHDYRNSIAKLVINGNATTHDFARSVYQTFLTFNVSIADAIREKDPTNNKACAVLVGEQSDNYIAEFFTLRNTHAQNYRESGVVSRIVRKNDTPEEKWQSALDLVLVNDRQQQLVPIQKLRIQGRH